MNTCKPNRHEGKIKTLVESVLNGPGQSESQLRQAVAQRVAAHCSRISANDLSLPEVLETYVDKIALHAYRITDALGFAIPSESGFASMAEVLLKRGY